MDTFVPLTISTSKNELVPSTNSSSGSKKSNSNILFSLSNKNSTLTNVRHYFKRQTIIGSRFWDFQPFKTMLIKSDSFCKSLNHIDRADEVFKHLFAYFISHIQPITQIERICPQFLIVPIVRNMPSMEKMITSYLPQLYENRLAKIRTFVHQFKGDIFLSFTTEELKFGLDMIKLHHKTSEGDIQFGYFLFIMVGTVDHKPQRNAKKYLLKVVRLMEFYEDNPMDDIFEDIFIDTLKLLWPEGDHLSRAAAQLKHIVADGDLLFDDLLRDLGYRYSELSHLVLTQNAHLLMHSIEIECRQRHQVACRGIDVVRMQLACSRAFRDKYELLSSDSTLPPKSFYQSAAYYNANFSQLQQVILQWRCPLFDNTAVNSTFSNAEFKSVFEDFAKSSSTLLEAIERASTVDVHVFSIQLADLFYELLQFYKDLHQHKVGDSVQVYVNWYVETIQREIGGSEGEKEILACGEYQLIKGLFEKLFKRCSQTSPLSQGRLTKYFLIHTIYTGKFYIPSMHKWANEQSLEPLMSSQLRRSFPRYWFFFKKFQVPLPLSALNEFSLVYAWAEANDHWTLPPNELEKIVFS